MAVREELDVVQQCLVMRGRNKDIVMSVCLLEFLHGPHCLIHVVVKRLFHLVSSSWFVDGPAGGSAPVGKKRVKYGTGTAVMGLKWMRIRCKRIRDDVLRQRQELAGPDLAGVVDGVACKKNE